MTSLGSFPIEASDAVGIAFLTLIPFAVYLLVESWMLGLRRACASGMLVLTCATYMASVLDLVDQLGDLTVPAMAFPVQAFLGLPVALILVLYGALVATMAWTVRYLRAARLGRITPDSVKEAVDALPDGVCFSTINGAPVLVNTQMDALAHNAFGSAIVDERTLWEQLTLGDCSKGYATRYADRDAGKALLVGDDGQAWQFSRRPLAFDGGDVAETIAADVTQEHALMAELDERNRQMAEVNERLRAYGRDLVKLTREEEILATRVRVHDEVGRALVALRAYERQDLDQRDRARLLMLWNRVANLLQGAEQPDVVNDDWTLLCEAAAAVDVRLLLTGELPSDAKARTLAVMVVHECLNNAVRHGDAHEVDVTCSVRDGMVELSVTNDGKVPSAPPEEAGGLSDVRASVERVGGILTVQWSPRVTVTAQYGLED